MVNKVLGVDYTTISRVSAFFTTLGLSDLFLMPEHYKPTPGHRVLHAFKMIRGLSHFAKKYRVVVFICPPYFHFPALLLLRLSGIRTLSIVVDLYSEMAIETSRQAPFYKRVLRSLMYPFYELSERISIKLSDAVFCVSAYSVNKYKKFKKSVHRVYNSADVAMISEVKPIVFKKDTIFYMGGFFKWRGIDLLVKAFEEVRKKHDVQLVLMGGSEEELRFYPELRELLAKSKNVSLVEYGPHEKAISYLKGSKIAVMPARDTFMTRILSSVKVFEYIAAEVPQVCTDTGEHAEWVRKLGAGIVVKDTPEEIAKGILTLLEDQKLYQKMKENCKAKKWEVGHKALKASLIRYFEFLKQQIG